MPYAIFEHLSQVACLGITVFDISGEIRYASPIARAADGFYQTLLQELDCAEAERGALLYGCYQARRFGGRYIFLAPSGLAYCVSPLIDAEGAIAAGAVAGPFLMTDYEEYIEIDVIERRSAGKEAAGRIAAGLGVIPFRTPAQARAVSELLYVCTACRRGANAAGPGPGRQFKALSAVYPIEKEHGLLSAISRGDIRAGAKRVDVIYKAISHIRRRFAEKITLQDLADAVYLNPTYFAKIFKDGTGRTPGSYITAVRIEESKTLLRDLSVKITDIPELIGLESQSYFTQIFRKAEGCTPKGFRQRHLDGGRL